VRTNEKSGAILVNASAVIQSTVSSMGSGINGSKQCYRERPEEIRNVGKESWIQWESFSLRVDKESVVNWFMEMI
jgi:hypothetical protein